MHQARTRTTATLCLPLLLIAVSGCDIMTADLKARETAEWRKSYTLQAGGRVEIRNVNGKIDVEPSGGSTVEVLAVKTARAGSQEAARELLGRIEIVETVSASEVKVETRLPRGGGFLHMG